MDRFIAILFLLFVAWGTTKLKKLFRGGLFTVIDHGFNDFEFGQERDDYIGGFCDSGSGCDCGSDCDCGGDCGCD